jgi:hypothetical protein
MGFATTKEERAAAFLAKAKEAMNHADKAKDPFERDSWLRIAADYRDLARMPGRWS